MTHDDQMKEILSKKEIFRLFAGGLPSLFDITDGGFSVLLDAVPLPCDAPLPLLRRLRDLTGMARAVALHEPSSFPFVSSSSAPVRDVDG